MKDSYVSNIEDILIANDTQKNKIQFLERERIKRDHYLQDLEQTIKLKNESLKEINKLGPNVAAINKLISQTDELANKIKAYYQEYQNLNAVLLMQKQMRLQDRRFYNERMVEFQNKIVDLRKYLHDKEDSFSSVVTRLKQYQDLAQNTMEDKLSHFKKEIGERHVNQFIAEILKEKSYYKAEYQRMIKDYVLFEELKKLMISEHPQIQDLLTNYEMEHKERINQLISGTYKAKQIIEQYQKQAKDKKPLKIDPNKELIRLLKKEKLSKELHEQALNEAIQKNQELVSIKLIYERNMQKLQKKCVLLYAQNTVFALRLAEYDSHYCRYATHNKRYYEEGEIQGLRAITEDRLREYAKKVQQYFESDIDLNKKFNEKLIEEVQKWSEFICDSPQIKREMDRKVLLRKSCSVPKLLVGFELDELAEEDKMIIEQY